VRRAKRKHTGVIDQDVDVAVSQLDSLSRDRTGARGIAKIGRNEIGFPARLPYFGRDLHRSAIDHLQERQRGDVLRDRLRLLLGFDLIQNRYYSLVTVSALRTAERRTK